MVQAAIPVVEIASPKPRMFREEMKLSINSVQSTKIPMAASSITQLSKNLRWSGAEPRMRVYF